MSERNLLPHALLAYLVLRVLVLWTAFDSVAIPVYEVPPMGNAAWLAADGWRVVPWIGPYDNAGGQILTAWLAAPLYALFGSRYAVLKLVPLLLGVGLIALVWRTFDKTAGRRAANVSALALALAPPLLFKYSLLAKGNHFEGLFFAFVPVCLYFEAQLRTRRGPWLAAAGLGAGFALSVYLGSLATLVALAAAAVAAGGLRRLLLDARFVLPGFALGALPLWILHRASAGRTGQFFAKVTSTDPQPAHSVGKKLDDVFVQHLPDATCCESLGPLRGEWLDALYLAGASLALVIVLARGTRGLVCGLRGRTRATDHARDSLALLVGVAPLVALAALVLTPLRISTMPAPVEIGGLRYFVPVHFWTLLALALVASRVGAGVRARLLGRAVPGFAAAALLVPGASSLAILRPTRPALDLALAYPGEQLRLFTAVMGHMGRVDPATGRHVLDPERVARLLDSMAPSERFDVAYSIGSRLWLHEMFLDPSAKLESVLGVLPEADRPAGAMGAGGAAANLRAPAGCAAMAERLSTSPYADAFVRGLGTEPEYPLARRIPQDWSSAVRIATVLPAGRRTLAYEGLGIDAGRRLGRRTRVEREAIAGLAVALPEESRDAFWRGALQGIAETLHGADHPARARIVDEMAEALDDLSPRASASLRAAAAR